ncbi:hypothetical protein CAEBREN_29011 [Caenorhabditis brenneri]|uniref:Uncharacterized protein n=1 Tax=Caenorhabditis brenneri TaxID=135651 RepID=G0PDK1_CAEBE|nr:hypothetical protein CAEBREN_29011 [Caenorhabditis brenneri]
MTPPPPLIHRFICPPVPKNPNYREESGKEKEYYCLKGCCKTFFLFNLFYHPRFRDFLFFFPEVSTGFLRSGET